MRATDITQKRLLVVVHPGSACGSADFNLGSQQAGEDRSFLAQDIAAWRDEVLVIDGNLSDELPKYPNLNNALVGKNRIFACAEETDNWPRVVAKALHSFDRETSIQITGAWFSTNDSGCVNTVYGVAERLGFKHVDVRDSAIRED